MASTMAMSAGIRENLAIEPAQADADGMALWSLHDPLRNTFYRLGWEEVEILQLLIASPELLQQPEAVVTVLARQRKVAVSSSQVSDFVEFLDAHNLTVCSEAVQRQRLFSRFDDDGLGPLRQTLKGYLFWKIPLVHPDAFLGKLLPYVKWLFHVRSLWLLTFIAIVAGYFSLRQWSSVSASLAGLLTAQGLFFFVLALSVVKALHELGHAFAAKYFGCRVTTLGVAFIVFWPVLYTDTTDAWRLSSPRQRFWIDAAGIIVELAVAVVCMALWYVLPAGLLKNICFLLATTTWLMTLAVNLNPLMRFDGYFMLSDYLGIDNLQGRAFGLGRWFMRYWLLGLREAAPEKPQAFMILYAYSTWVYRTFLFIGISLIIYTLFFKVLGIALVLAFIFSAVLKPLLDELRYCFSKRHEVSVFPNLLLSVSLLALLLFWAVGPSAKQLSIPAYAGAKSSAILYAPIDGQLLQVPVNDQRVDKGQLLFSVHNPDMHQQLELVDFELTALNWQLQRHSVAEGRLQSLNRLQGELAAVLDKQKSLQVALAASNAYAAFGGVVTDVEPTLGAGAWVAKGSAIAMLVNTSRLEVVAYLPEHNVQYVPEGTQGRFYFDGGVREPVDVMLTRLESTAIADLEQPYNASIYGGDLAVREEPSTEHRDNRLIPVEATYRLTLLGIEPAPERVLSGRVVLKVEAESFIQRVVRQALGLWRREANF